MTPEDGLLHLTDIIRFELRPPMHQHSVDIAKQAQLFHARESAKQREELKKIRKSESDDQLDQRQRLTNAITSVALGPVYSYAEQVWRTDGVTKRVDDESVPQVIRERVSDHYRNYYHGASLHRYCFDAALHYTKVDPNAWTVFEARFASGAAGQTIIDDFYPVEVTSDEVRGYAYDEVGKLQYLAFEFKRMVYKPDDPSNKRPVSDFFLYAAGFSIHFAEFDPLFTDGVDYEALGYQVTDIKNRRFYVRLATNTTTEVPAIRWAAYMSDEHQRKIGETLVAPAIPILEELLKDNSLLQLTKFLHVFPEKHQYVRRCNHQDEYGAECRGGWYGGVRDEKNRCRACKGTGKIMAASEQDVITLAWPDRAEDLVDLAKLTHYVERPIEILEQYRDMVREALPRIFTAVYNQQNVDFSDVAQAATATQVRLEYDKIYNKLGPFAELIARAWEKAQRVGFQYYGQEVTADMTYPHDFKMKTTMELLEEYKLAKDAGAPYEVLFGLASDMLAKMYRNSPEKAMEVEAFERWKPWKDKSAEEIAMIIQFRADDDPDKVLWENWSRVMEEVRLRAPMFVEMPPDQQRDLLYRTAQELAAGMRFTQLPDPFAPAVPITGNQDGDIDEEDLPNFE